MNDAEEIRRLEQLIDELRKMRRPYGTSERAYGHYSQAVSSLLSVQKLLQRSGNPPQQ